ncbi:MAG: DUF2334 domain-containing protein [Calditrichaeota bacterium]|nr:DUF2334 domain-containing protein [Calditrichota bacterium]
MMDTRKTVLFHCQHSMGMGHLVRSLTLAKTLAKRFRVVLLNGGELPEGMTFPSELDVIHLPPIGQLIDHSLYSIDTEITLEQAQEIRLHQIMKIFNEIHPDVLFIELFPFGRKKFVNELLPLLEAANALGKNAPITACSLRDILVGNRKDQEQHENRAALLANRYFDAVLSHADPDFAQLEETFQPQIPLKTPVFYTGFVLPKQEIQPVDFSEIKISKTLVVSAGGGRFGYDIFRNAATIAPALGEHFGLKVKIITGPFLPDDEFVALKKQSAEIANLEVIKFVPNLHKELCAARASISQCGYNTTMDLLQSKVPSLVIPFSEGEEDEQLIRAQRLAKLGQLQYLIPQNLTPESLFDAVKNLLNFRPDSTPLNLNGAEKTGEILAQLIGERDAKQTRAAAKKQTYSEWLKPVLDAMNRAPLPVKFFFRDDDAGWRTDRLQALLKLFDRYHLPIDLAVIPTALDASTINFLKAAKATAPQRIGLHQHGYLHQNYQSEGRNCEFGSDRSLDAQFEDISRGKALLEDIFGRNALDAIFTPPWNRCKSDTAKVLQLLNFEALSRDETAEPLHQPGLIELPIRIDWLRKRKGVALTREEFGEYLAAGIRKGKMLGLMFHHAEMDDANLQELDELLHLLAAHSYAKFYPMRELVQIKFEKLHVQNNFAL